MKKRRVAGMIGGGLALAFLLFAGLSVADRIEVTSDPDADDAQRRLALSKPIAASLTPVSIAQVSELPGPSLRLSGTAEAASVVMLLDRGERVRQVRSNADGLWSATLDVPDRPMAIEAVLFEDSAVNAGTDAAASAPGLRGVETVFRIHRPADQAAGLPPLIMIAAPAAPTRLVSSPFGGLPASGPLAMGAIDYDDAGGVIFSGVSAEPGRVRLYVSNSAIGETRVGADGRWAYIAASVMPLGEYDVRAELLPTDPAAARASVSVPFERLRPVRATEGADDEGALSVNFEPFRWQIRRSLVGGGMQSTAIFAPEELSAVPDLEPAPEPAPAAE